MGRNSEIEWLNGGHTASPWYGCSHVHAGCDNCYAEALAKRNPATLGIWGDEGTRVKSKSFIANLRKWNAEARAAGRIDSVFPSLCDPFEDRPELAPWRQEMFEVIDECESLRLLLLTKRPENVLRMWPLKNCIGRMCNLKYPTGITCADGECDVESHVRPSFRNNVWLLTSVSDQETADKAIPELLKCRDLVPVLGVSYEPALGPVDFETIRDPNRFPGCAFFDVLRGRMIHEDDGYQWTPEHGHLDWIIVGGESGSNARPFNVEWARSTIRQCKDAGVACFIKQMGREASMDNGIGPPAERMYRGAYWRFKDKKGGDWAEWPEELRVREFPASSPN